MIRSGCRPAHSSWCQSFHARTHASPSSGSWLRANDGAREPGDERREAQRRLDAVEVHVGDPGVGCPSSRAASRRSGPAPSSTRPWGGRRPRSARPAGSGCPRTPTARGAPRRLDDPGGAVGEAPPASGPRTGRAGSMRWSSTEMSGKCLRRGSGSGRSGIGVSACCGRPGRGAPRCRCWRVGRAHRARGWRRSRRPVARRVWRRPGGRGRSRWGGARWPRGRAR